MLETWRRIVTDSSDIVHSQPVPLVLPHPSLPGDNILTLRWFFEKQIWWRLTDELWASCSWAPCCGWTARSWLASPSSGIQPAIIHVERIQRLRYTSPPIVDLFLSQVFYEINAERRRREILDGFTKGTHARHDPKFELKFFYICKWKKDLCHGIGAWGYESNGSQRVAGGEKCKGWDEKRYCCPWRSAGGLFTSGRYILWCWNIEFLPCKVCKRT